MSEGFCYHFRQVLWNESTWALDLTDPIWFPYCRLSRGVRHCGLLTGSLKRNKNEIKKVRGSQQKTDRTAVSQQESFHLVYSTVGRFHSDILKNVTWLTVTTWNVHKSQQEQAFHPAHWKERGKKSVLRCKFFIKCCHASHFWQCCRMAESRSKTIQPNDVVANEAVFDGTLFNIHLIWAHNMQLI